MSYKRLYTSNSLYVLQSRYAQNSFQGGSRWAIVEPSKKSLHGAIGKDGFPPVLELLARASSREGITQIDGLHTLIDKRLMYTKASDRTDELSFLKCYHQFVRNYPFNDYRRPNRWNKDREQMVEYGKISPPPPQYTNLADHPGKRLDMPIPEFRRIGYATSPRNLDPLTATATALAGTLQATGSINGGDFGPWLRKACPSGGARHPTEVRLSMRGVPNVKDGVWIYDAQHHQLVYEDDLRYIPMKQAQSIYWEFITRVERPMWRYREARSLRPVIIDGGHVIQNIRMFLQTMGFTLSLVKMPADNDFESFDFNAPLLAKFRMDGPKLNPSACVSRAIKKMIVPPNYDPNQEYFCNPFLWLSFGEGELWGNCEYPISSKIRLDKEDFLILNYCIPSKRGDRPSRTVDINHAFGFKTNKRMQMLVSGGFLITSSDSKYFDRKIEKWCRFGWYQNLLVCLHIHNVPMRNEIFQVENNVHSLARPTYTLSDFRHITTKRRTTRSFLRAPLPQPLIDTITDCVQQIQEVWSGQVSARFCRFDGDKGQLWQMPGRCPELIKVNQPISRSEMIANCIGQFPLQTVDSVLWLYAETPIDEPAHYMSCLLNFGAIAQKLCVHCADKDIGVFLSPAVNDSQTQAMLSLPASKDYLFYMIAFGLPDSTQIGKRVTPFEDFLQRGDHYIETGQSGGILINKNGRIRRTERPVNPIGHTLQVRRTSGGNNER